MLRARRLGHRIADGENVGFRVQRQIVDAGEQVVGQYDLAGNTTLGFTPFATTIAVINGHDIPGSPAARALVGPTLNVTQQPDGTFRATAGAEAVNHIGYRIEMPTPPPWIVKAGVDHATQAVEMLGGKALLNPVRHKLPANGEITLHVHGLPNDAAFFQLVRKHEQRHVDDVAQAVAVLLTPWDEALREPGRRGDGASAEAAEAAFYADIGTPAEMGTSFLNMFAAQGKAFHETPEGGNPTIAKVEVDGFFSKTLHVYWRHPMG